jgi:hypothetical protein
MGMTGARGSSVLFLETDVCTIPCLARSKQEETRWKVKSHMVKCDICSVV